jgi:tRNA(Ile2) C34 agmatinyltransferase TiaS
MSQIKKVNSNSKTYKYFQKLKNGICPRCVEYPTKLDGDIYDYICPRCRYVYSYESIDVYFDEIGEEYER